MLPPFGLEGDTLGDPSFKGGVVVEGLALVVVDGAWLLVSPLIAIAVVQQLLPQFYAS